VPGGTFTREEITEIYRSLHRADPGAVRSIVATPALRCPELLGQTTRRPSHGVPLGIRNIRHYDHDLATCAGHSASCGGPAGHVTSRHASSRTAREPSEMGGEASVPV
jgi:hypothetical protein